MNSNRQNSNNFLLGVSSNKNNSLEKINNRMQNNTIKYNNLNTSYSPLETKKIVFGIIDKLESDIVELNNKIYSLNKEKIDLKNLSNKEVVKLKEVIKKLYMILLSLNKASNKSSNLSKNDRIELLNKLKNTIEQNNSFLQITNKIVRNDKLFNNSLNKRFNNSILNNTSLINESLNKNNNNVSLSNIIAIKNSEAKESVENNSRMNDNAFLKREEVLTNNNPEVDNMSIKLLNNGNQSMGNINMTEKVSNNGTQNVNISIESLNNSLKNMNSTEKLSNNSNIKELSNNKNIYKSENKELTQSKRIPLMTKINEHKINQEKANQNFNEYKKLL